MTIPTRITDPAKLILPKIPQEVALGYSRPTEAEIERELEKKLMADTKPRKSRTTLTPSLFSLESCDLEAWFTFKAEEYPYSHPMPGKAREWTRANVLGNFLHDAWQQALTESSIGLACELPPFAEHIAQVERHNFSPYMRLDVLLDLGSNIEIKGVAEKDFDPASPWIHSKLKPDQSLLYQHFYNLKRTHYIVVNRDADNWFSPDAVLEYEMDYHPLTVNALLTKGEGIIEAVRRGEQPHYRPKESYCKNLCGYKAHCVFGRKFV